ncbi:phenylacetate--CoA ligase family protein [Catenulispora rubra]|uniref:phenylacetate--CoA ligase family protein n=1 Tax=Catenulispora rubra TaxID=280293 RepID=UPI0018925DA1|nr:phenylacetate--CoA ligase family protein [Catenulispora rubra]
MYTVFRPELDGLAREILARYRAYQEGRTTPAELEAHQLDAFVATLGATKKHSPLYRERLADIEPTDVKALTPEALAGIPFTTKDDLRDHGFGMSSLPVHRAWVYYETTGTTGASTPSPRADVDSLNTNIAMTVQYEPLLRGFGEEQVMGVCGPSELHAHGDTFTEVCRNLGYASVKMWPYSPMVGFERALRVMRELPVTGLFCTPGMAVALAKAAIRSGSDPRRDFAMDVLMLTGETAPPSLLAHIGRLWGAQAHLSLYGSQESSVLALGSVDGSLRLTPLLNYYEVVDPVSLKPAIADADGVLRGEMVATHLYQGAKPLVRYRTGDLVRLHPDARVEVLGRAVDRLVLNGAETSVYELEDLLIEGIDGFLDHRILIDRRAGRDVLTLVLTPANDGDGAGPRGVEPRIAACRETFDTEVELVVADAETVIDAQGPVSWKTPRIHDRRATG